LRTAWRIVKAKHQVDAFNGEGARLYGGRWNHRGTAVVYLSDSLALAALEQFVHLGKAGSALALVVFEIAIPDRAAIEVLAQKQLPPNWREEPPPDETKELGTQWVRRNAAVALRVPSAIIPHEANYVINPAHADFRKLAIKPPTPFSFDPRMWK
jgi:RES domain-containing protein